MADFVFPPGGENVTVTAPNGITYVWDVDNGRWAIKSNSNKVSSVVHVGVTAPSNSTEGDLWYNTNDAQHHDLYINVSSAWEQAAPGKQEHIDLIERVSILEDTSERVSQYECHATHSASGELPPQGKFSSGGTSVKYINKFRLHRIDAFQNPLPILHDGDGLEMLHNENGHSFRFTITSAYEGPEGDLDQVIEVKYLGGHNDSVKIGDHYIFKFHTPSSDTELIAHLEKDQTFTGANTFDGDVVFTGNVTLPDADGDGNGDNVPTLDGDNTFTGNNIFAKTTLKSDDDSHRLYMKDKDNNTNLTIFPTGNISSKGRMDFTAKGNDTFANLYSSKIKVNPADGWDPNSDGDFGFYIDISAKNSFKNRFVVGGRAGREKAFEVYDDGEGVVRSYGKILSDGKIQAKTELQVDGGSQFLDDVQLVGNLGGSTNAVVEDIVYICYAVNLSQSGSFSKWREVGCSTPQVGHVFKATSSSQLIGTDRVKTYTGDVDLMVSGDVSVGGILMGDNIEGHEFYFSGGGEVNGPIIFTDSVKINYELDLQSADVKNEFSLSGTMNVTGKIDLSNALVSNNTPIPKSYFTRILKEYNNEFRSVYINHGTNGTADPPIEIKASTSAGNLIQCRNSSNNVRWGVSVHSGHMFGGTSAAPWLPTSDHHFAVKKYVDNQINTVENKIQTSSGPTGMWFKFGGDNTSISGGEFILNGNRLIFDTYNDDGLLWLGGVTTEDNEQSIWSHCSIYRQNGNTFVLDRMFQLEKMRVGTTFSNRRTLNFTKIYQKYGSGLPTVGTRYLISCGGFF